MRIGPRLLFNSILIAAFAVFTSALLIGLVSYNHGKKVLEERARAKMMLIRDNKGEDILRYFDNLKNNAIIFSENETIISAMKDFDSSFKLYAEEVKTRGLDIYNDKIINNYIAEFAKDYAKDNGGMQFDAKPYLNLSNPSTFALQYNYIFANPYGIDKESTLDYVDDGSTYSKLHSRYHPHLRHLMQLFGFNDIFLVEPKNGNIVYTVAKGLDFTTSLTKGPFANTALAKVFRLANNNDGHKATVVSGFEPFAPSNDNQSCFIASTIFDKGKKIGVLIFEIDSAKINEIMTNNNKWAEIGLGESGEIYLVDQHKLMLSKSRFFVENQEQYLKTMQSKSIGADAIARMKAKDTNVGIQLVNTFGVEQALAGNAGVAIYDDYRGIKVLGAYEPLNISGMSWAVLSEMDYTEMLAPIGDLARVLFFNLLGIAILVLLFSVVVGVGLAKRISVPLEDLSAQIVLLAKTQDLTRKFDISGSDEIADISKSLNSLIESFRQTCQETISSTEKVQSTANRLLALANDIDSTESAHKFEDNYEVVHEKTEAIKKAGGNLEELAERLQLLSKQFKVFEQEAHKKRGW